jgi:adenylate cyclase
MSRSTIKPTAEKPDILDNPYPIFQRFIYRILPILILFISILVIATTSATKEAIEQVYLQLAIKRGEGIAHGVSYDAPKIWQNLLAGQQLNPTDFKTLEGVILNELNEFKISKIKIYNLDRLTLYATTHANIGIRENGAGLAWVIDTGKANIISKREGREVPLYELYVPLMIDGEIKAIFELYEPATLLDDIFLQTMRPAAIWPTLLFTVLVFSLWLIIRDAQHDIDSRTTAINSLRNRLESLISRSAVDAVRRTTLKEKIPTELVECSLFYSDIRSFSSFAEQHTPQEVIDFLNEIMELQIDIIHQYNGDVDKMVGDAVLARFQGPGRQSDAVLAASKIQQELARKTMPRGIGIGIYSGQVIAGGIGPQNRLDYTIIGDTVNVSARLCALADVGEIVVDCQTLEKVEDRSEFEAEQSVKVKGRQGNLQIQKKIIPPSPEPGNYS